MGVALGHRGYYAQAKPVLYDIAELLKYGSSHAQRTRITPVIHKTNQKYWRI